MKDYLITGYSSYIRLYRQVFIQANNKKQALKKALKLKYFDEIVSIIELYEEVI